MDNPEEVMQILERFNVQKNPEINPILEEYLQFVARTGDSVYAWALVKNLFREKLVNVITEFYNETPVKELPTYPNVDPFNYETMKKMLLEKLDSFTAAPFTIQRISELLSEPRKQYSRVDKFMRAVEKTILVVSTVPPGRQRTESGDSLDSGMNGDFSDVNVDIDMDGHEANQNSNHKENNHEVSNENDKTGESEESKDEVKGTITKVTVDKVSITVIEPERSKVDETKTSNEPSTSSTEPIRSAENEILVETAEMISETPPLAALENIVATTDPSLTENVSPVIATSATPETTKVDELKETAVDDIPEDSSETENKRMKISEDVEKVEETTEAEKIEVPSEVKTQNVDEETKADDEKSQPPVSDEITAEIPSIQVQVEETAEIQAAPIEAEKIDEPTPEIPIETSSSTETPTEAATEMETVPVEISPPLTLPVESKMDDEEQQTTTTVEQEMTPVTSKMDTDESSTTVEAAPMEFEVVGEPMDQ